MLLTHSSGVVGPEESPGRLSPPGLQAGCGKESEGETSDRVRVKKALPTLREDREVLLRLVWKGALGWVVLDQGGGCVCFLYLLVRFIRTIGLMGSSLPPLFWGDCGGGLDSIALIDGLFVCFNFTDTVLARMVPSRIRYCYLIASLLILAILLRGPDKPTASRRRLHKQPTPKTLVKHASVKKKTSRTTAHQVSIPAPIATMDAKSKNDHRRVKEKPGRISLADRYKALEPTSQTTTPLDRLFQKIITLTDDPSWLPLPAPSSRPSITSHMTHPTRLRFDLTVPSPPKLIARSLGGVEDLIRWDALWSDVRKVGDGVFWVGGRHPGWFAQNPFFGGREGVEWVGGGGGRWVGERWILGVSSGRGVWAGSGEGVGRVEVEVLGVVVGKTHHLSPYAAPTPNNPNQSRITHICSYLPDPTIMTRESFTLLATTILPLSATRLEAVLNGHSKASIPLAPHSVVEQMEKETQGGDETTNQKQGGGGGLETGVVTSREEESLEDELVREFEKRIRGGSVDLGVAVGGGCGEDGGGETRSTLDDIGQRGMKEEGVL
ncbi:hypothetical protein HDU67_003755 [Dinochytrium kinnereticum]|nr:hypothetical protein HDU67_003755 [Dinochytrium kinnereticum]